MPRIFQWLLGIALAAVLVGGPIGYARYQKTHFRNFRTVQSGQLYRSGQLSADGLKRVVHDYGLRTVITLRDPREPGDPPPDLAEEKYCRDQELYYFRLPHRSLAREGSVWLKVNGKARVDANVERFLKIIDDPKNHPVLVHCLAGMHRTGAYVAIYRMEYDRWTSAEAIAEMKAAGYDNIEEQNDILGYLQTYVPRWKQGNGSGAD
jgi:protein tyrosine/serine phosphatase